jgi:transposase-like protein
MPERKFLTPEQKVSILRRHFVEKVPISDLCDEFGIHPTQFYNWQKQLFENAAPIFERRGNSANERRHKDAQAKRIAELEAKVQKKNEVVAELLEEHVQLKKELGEP